MTKVALWLRYIQDNSCKPVVASRSYQKGWSTDVSARQTAQTQNQMKKRAGTGETQSKSLRRYDRSIISDHLASHGTCQVRGARFTIPTADD